MLMNVSPNKKDKPKSFAVFIENKEQLDIFKKFYSDIDWLNYEHNINCWYKCSDRVFDARIFVLLSHDFTYKIIEPINQLDKIGTKLTFGEWYEIFEVGKNQFKQNMKHWFGEYYFGLVVLGTIVWLLFYITIKIFGL